MNDVAKPPKTAQNMQEACELDGRKLYEFVEEFEKVFDILQGFGDDFPNCYHLLCKQAESNGEIGLHQAVEAFQGVNKQIKAERLRLIKALLSE